MYRMLRSTAPLTAALLFVAAGAVRADSRDEAMARAEKFLEKKDTAKLILFLAHPEGDYRGITLNGRANVRDRRGQLLPGAFALVYDIEWRSPLSGDTNTTRLAFLFLEDGTVEVQKKSTTSFFEPFSNTNLVLNWVKDAIRKDEKLRQDKALMTLVDNGDAKGILEFFLKVGWLANK